MLSACFSVIFTLYLECILSLELYNNYGVDHSLLGLYFFLSSITYVVGAPFSSYLSTIINRRYVVLLAFGLMVLQSFLSGPSPLFGLSNNLTLIVIGVSMMGFNLSMTLVPLLSELIETLEGLGIYEPSQISDMTASLFNSMFNLGNLVAPVLAGLLDDNLGYKATTDIMMVASSVYCAVFYFIMIFRKVSFRHKV